MTTISETASPPATESISDSVRTRIISPKVEQVSIDTLRLYLRIVSPATEINALLYQYLGGRRRMDLRPEEVLNAPPCFRIGFDRSMEGIQLDKNGPTRSERSSIVQL